MIEFMQAIEFAYRTYLTPGVVFFAMTFYGCFVQALPEPDEHDGKAYRFIYAFAHMLANNVNVTRKTLKRPSGWNN